MATTNKKTVKIKENELVNLIENIITETVKKEKTPIKEKNSIKEMDDTPAGTTANKSDIKRQTIEIARQIASDGAISPKEANEILSKLEKDVELAKTKSGAQTKLSIAGTKTDKVYGMKEQKKSIKISESKLVDLIENIITEMNGKK